MGRFWPKFTRREIVGAAVLLAPGLIMAAIDAVSLIRSWPGWSTWLALFR